tara:strand:+ start:165 stop:344 length:180 start_codon:yes stop_codon:yes gene_type:complete
MQPMEANDPIDRILMPEPTDANDKKEPTEKPLPIQNKQNTHASDSIDAIEIIENTLRHE